MPFQYIWKSKLHFGSAFFWDITRRVVAIPYRRFGTTHRPHIQDSGNPITWPFKMGTIGCPETSVSNYHYTLRNSPGERRSHLILGGSLKSRKITQSPFYEVRLRWQQARTHRKQNHLRNNETEYKQYVPCQHNRYVSHAITQRTKRYRCL